MINRWKSSYVRVTIKTKLLSPPLFFNKVFNLGITTSTFCSSLKNFNYRVHLVIACRSFRWKRPIFKKVFVFIQVYSARMTEHFVSNFCSRYENKLVHYATASSCFNAFFPTMCQHIDGEGSLCCTSLHSMR